MGLLLLPPEQRQGMRGLRRREWPRVALAIRSYYLYARTSIYALLSIFGMSNPALPIWTAFHVKRIQIQCLHASRNSLARLPAPNLTIINTNCLSYRGNRHHFLKVLDDAAPEFVLVLDHLFIRQKQTPIS